MRILLLLALAAVLLQGGDSGTLRQQAREAASRQRWRTAAELLSAAIAGCGASECTVERIEIAGFYLRGGFPEASAAMWRRILASKPELRPLALLGLGVSLHAAGKKKPAIDVFRAACRESETGSREEAACRFNLALVSGAPQWSELEELLPRLNGQDEALAATARAALAEGKEARAAELAGRIADKRLRLLLNLEIAQAGNQSKLVKQWKRELRKMADGEERWESGTVRVEDLRRERPR